MWWVFETKNCFAQYVLTRAELISVQSVKESAVYVCGAELFSSEDPIYNKVYVRRNLECESPIEFAYFSSNLSLPLVCFYCGCFNATRNKDLLKKFKSVMPLCEDCAQTKPQVYKYPLNKASAKED